MGALAGQAQRRDVLTAVERLKSAATVVAGGGSPDEVAGADAATGAFTAPTLLRCDDPDRAETHAVEAFGPVSTLIGYRDHATVAAVSRPSLDTVTTGSPVTASHTPAPRPPPAHHSPRVKLCSVRATNCSFVAIAGRRGRRRVVRRPPRP